MYLGRGWRDFSAVSFQENLLEDDFQISKSNSWKIQWQLESDNIPRCDQMNLFGATIE